METLQHTQNFQIESYRELTCQICLFNIIKYLSKQGLLSNENEWLSIKNPLLSPYVGEREIGQNLILWTLIFYKYFPILKFWGYKLQEIVKKGLPRTHGAIYLHRFKR